MHKDTKALIFLFVGLIVAATAFWLFSPHVVETLDSWGGGHHESGESGAGAEGDDQAASAAEHEEHLAHLGIYQNLVIFLAITCTLFSVVTLFLILLTVGRWEKERGHWGEAH